MSRFLSESRFSNAINKLPRAYAAGTRMASVGEANTGKSQFSTGGDGQTDLDDSADLVDRDMVSRHGLFRRSFRANGPQVRGDRADG